MNVAPPLQSPTEARLDAIADRLGDVTGHVNVLQAEVVNLAAEFDEHHLLAHTGCKTLEQWIGWQTGSAPATAKRLARLARTKSSLPKVFGLFAEGLLSLDQASTVAGRLPEDESKHAKFDTHFAQLAPELTVGQLRRALRIAVPPEDPKPTSPDPREEDAERRQITFGTDDDGRWWLRAEAPAAEGALIEAGIQAHYEALMNEWKARCKELEVAGEDTRPPLPTWFDAFERMVDRSLEREAADRPWSSRTKVVVHVEVPEDPAARAKAALHLGPALSQAERSLLMCDADIVTVLERFGTPVSVGRTHRITPDKTRMVVEQRDGRCRMPWCSSKTRLVMHHIEFWEDGGPTDTGNLVAVCPYDHRQLHRGVFSVSGNADDPDGLTILDARGRPITGKSAARSPGGRPPPSAPRYVHPSGERADWNWYIPPRFDAVSEN